MMFLMSGMHLPASQPHVSFYFKQHNWVGVHGWDSFLTDFVAIRFGNTPIAWWDNRIFSGIYMSVHYIIPFADICLFVPFKVTLFSDFRLHYM